MTNYLGESCSFGLLCLSFVNLYVSVCVLLSLLVLGWGLIVSILDHCFLFSLHAYIIVKGLRHLHVCVRSNIPLVTAYGVYVSQQLRYARAYCKYQ